MQVRQYTVQETVVYTVIAGSSEEALRYAQKVADGENLGAFTRVTDQEFTVHGYTVVDVEVQVKA
jgi:hypothetical protein